MSTLSETRYTLELPHGAVPVLQLQPIPAPPRTVLVLHGLGASAGVQRKELNSLAAHGYTAVGIDAPHHGARSSPLLEALRAAPQPLAHERFLALLAEATEELPHIVDALAARGLGPFGVLGISMGAFTALAAAAEDVRLGVVVSILGSPDWTPPRTAVTEGMRPWLGRAPVHRPERLAGRALLLGNAALDTSVPPGPARRFAERLVREHGAQAVRYVEYPASGHFMREEDWNALWQLSLEWLGEHLGAA